MPLFYDDDEDQGQDIRLRIGPPQEPPQEEEENPYRALIREQQRTDAALTREAMRAQKDVQPDTRAEALRLSDTYKVPVDVVERNLDIFRARAQEDETDYEELTRRAPKLAEWVRTHSELAAAGKDDLPALIEATNTVTWGASILRGVDDSQALFGRFVELMERERQPVG